MKISVFEIQHIPSTTLTIEKIVRWMFTVCGSDFSVVLDLADEEDEVCNIIVLRQGKLAEYSEF